jgi:hypothetical protein
MRYEVLTATLIKILAFRDVTVRKLVESSRVLERHRCSSTFDIDSARHRVTSLTQTCPLFRHKHKSLWYIIVSLSLGSPSVPKF